MKSLKLFVGCIALSAMIFTACEDDKTNPVAENGSATISGIAYVDLTTLNDTNVVEDWDYEFVPEGTVLYATLNTAELTLVTSYATYDDMIIETTVGANGAFSFTVPANRKAVSVELSGDDFSATYVEGTASDTVTSQKIFKLAPVTLSNVHDGAIRLKNLYYE